MGVTGIHSRPHRAALRTAIALVVAAATVLTPLGGLPRAEAALNDLPDRTWGVVDFGRSVTTRIPAEVIAIEQVGNTIYAGGFFREVVRRRAVNPHVNQAYLAAFDATTGEYIDWWTPQLNGAVFALEASADGSRLYVGGDFTEVNGHPGTTGLVALDPASGRVDHTWTPRIESAFSDDPGVVRTIKESGGFLYIGGNFTHVTGNNPSSRRSVDKVARLSLTTAAIDSSWTPVVSSGAVWGLDHDPVRGRVYLAGFFESVNGVDPSDNFAVVNDTNGSTITGLNRFPELTPNQDHQFEVIAHGDYVWVVGTQHVLHMLNASDLSINRRWFTGFEDGFHIGGDYQALGILGGVMYAACHCFGVLRELPNWVTTLAEARDIQPLTDEVQGIMGFDLDTGDYVTGWAPDIYGSIGAWAVHGAGDGCLWAGGDLNRRTVGDTWRNGLVRWCDEGGQGPPVGPPLVQQPPPETNPPSVPPGFTADDVGDGTVDLSWGAASDDTAVAYYRVYRNGQLLRATKSLSLIDLAATPGDSYTVRAVDPYGNESADSAVATPTLGGHLEPVLNHAFDGNDGSFAYTDGAFGTSLPDYEDGLVRRDGGSPDGNLMVILGGVDNDDDGPFSAAWQRGFNMPQAGDVEISLMYRLEVKDALENDEYGEARAAIDGTQLNGGFLQRIAGGGNSGWVNYTTTVSLSAGAHVLSLGGYQNFKTISNEFVEVSFDDVSVTPLIPAVGFTTPVPGSEVAGPTALELRASSLRYASSQLDVDVSSNGGATWSAATWNAATSRFEFTFDFTAAPEGPYELRARVRDPNGRTGFGDATYQVNNDSEPTISIAAPAAGADVSGVVTVRIDADDAEDPAGSLDVEVSTDGATWNDAGWNGAAYTYSWDTSVNGDGPATIEARVTDSLPTTVHATPVDVTVVTPLGYRQTVVRDGAVALWRLGERTGPAVDIVGGHDGTYTGGPIRGVTGLVSGPGRAVRLDGTNDFVPFPVNADVNSGGPYPRKSVELWFKADDVNPRQVLWEEGASGRGISIYLLRGRLYGGAWNTLNDPHPTTPWAAPVFVSAPVSPNTTYHVVLTFDQPNDKLALYINGIEVADADGLGLLFAHAGVSAIGAMNNGTRFHDRGDRGGDKYFFDGVIDEVAAYNVALTPAQVANHYGLGGPELGYAATIAAAGAKVYWRLGESAGAVARDVFGGSDATYLGAPGRGAPGLILEADSAVSFDGTNDIVAVPSGPNVNTSIYRAKTVELWFKADTVTRRQVLWEEGAAARGISIYLRNGRLYAAAWNTVDDPHRSTPWAAPVWVSTPVTTSTVYYVAVVFDYPNDSFTLYVNGVEAATTSGVGLLYQHGLLSGIGAMNDGTRFHDRSDGGGDKYFFDGTIDEVALYTDALTPAQIANHHTIGRP